MQLISQKTRVWLPPDAAWQRHPEPSQSCSPGIRFGAHEPASGVHCRQNISVSMFAKIALRKR
jgi:hypothetical protein